MSNLFQRVFPSSFAKFSSDERGTAAIEYSLMASLIAMAIIAVVFTIGSDIKTVLYDKIATALTSL